MVFPFLSLPAPPWEISASNHSTAASTRRLVSALGLVLGVLLEALEDLDQAASLLARFVQRLVLLAY